MPNIQRSIFKYLGFTYNLGIHKKGCSPVSILIKLVFPVLLIWAILFHEQEGRVIYILLHHNIKFW